MSVKKYINRGLIKTLKSFQNTMSDITDIIEGSQMPEYDADSLPYGYVDASYGLCKHCGTYKHITDECPFGDSQPDPPPKLTKI